MSKTFKPGQTMKINIQFTKEQFWDLMRSLYMADWMANAICEMDMKEDKGIKDIRDYIFSFAKEMGYGDYVEYDDEHKKFYATLDMDDEPTTRKLVERYDEHSFWDEIIERLGERDFFRKYARSDMVKMNKEEYFTKCMESEQVWAEEFEKHGIDRLEIVDRKNIS